jgi:DNA adenine methylase
MKYLGSKARIAKFILPIMLEEARVNNITTWVEPFCGGLNSLDKVPNTFKRIGIDCNPHTIAALIGIRDRLEELPDNVSEEYYKSIKKTPPDPITSWVRFECSFGAKFENGYARHGNKEKYRKTPAEEGKRNAIKQSPLIQGVELICDSYENYSHLENCLIYCDPPYFGTTTYKTAPFDHQKFFNWCRLMAKNNTVFVSEYSAPDDFQCVWQGEIQTNFSSTRTCAAQVMEKLFKVKKS